MAVTKITGDTFELVKNADTAVVDFYADWCGPCGMLSPIVEKLSTEYENVDFYKVDIDADMDIAQIYRIVSIPTLLFFKKGEVVGQVIGYVPEDELKAEIDKAFA
ncbi:MAG: thioredoxin [Lachnospiraceae bacterium]|nr:thioredoxin [Lachnospiraceae bacterium]